MKKIKVNGFDFQTENNRRQLVVSLNNGSSWIIKESVQGEAGFPAQFNGTEDREPTKAERIALQKTVDAFYGFLTGEEEGFNVGYSDLVDIDTFAEIFDWDGAGLPVPTEDEGGPSYVLTDCAMFFIPL